MDNLRPATSSSNLWNNVYQVPEGANEFDADIEKFNHYCNMIIFNNGFQVSPQLRATAMQMQSFMDAMKQHGVSQADFYNFAKASLPVLEREHEKLSVCSVRIDENQALRHQKRDLMLNKISGTQLKLTYYSAQSSIFETKIASQASQFAGTVKPYITLKSNLEKMGLAEMGTTVLNFVGEGISGWLDEVANNVERHAKTISNKNPQIKSKCQKVLNIGPQLKKFIGDQLDKMAPLVEGFDKFPTNVAVNAATGMNSVESFYSGNITQEEAFIGALADLHVISTVAKLAGHVLIESAKAVCSVHPNVKGFCKGTLNVAVKVIKTSAEWTGLKEPIKSGLNYINSLDGFSIAEVLVQQGMSPQQALFLGKQAATDMKIVGFTAVPLGTVGILLKKGVSVSIGGAVKVVKTSTAVTGNLLKSGFATIKSVVQKEGITNKGTVGKVAKVNEEIIAFGQLSRGEGIKEGLNGVGSTVARNPKSFKANKHDQFVLQNVPDIKNMPSQFQNLSLDFLENFTQRGSLYYQEVGKDMLFFLRSPAKLKTSVENVVESAIKYATLTNKNRIFMCWDPLTHSLASVVKAQSKEIIAFGQLSRGEGIFPLNVIEVAIGGTPKKLTGLKANKLAVATVAKKNSVIAYGIAKDPSISIKAKLKNL